MNRQETVLVVQKILNSLNLGGYVNRQKAALVFDEIVDQILLKSLVVDGGMTIRNFGTFSVRDYQGRQVPDPQNAEQTLTVGPYKAVSFRAAPRVKGAVNGKETDLSGVAE